ncbi:MAG: sulfurtransferase [Pseudomonadota bacterium]
MARSQLISVRELSDILNQEDLRVIDCRFDLGRPEAGRGAYLAGHIPGAVYAHLDDDLAGPVSEKTGRHPLPDPDELAARLGAMGVASNTRVVVYDAGNGAIAARAWWLLRWLGHDEVQLLNGGFAAWQKNGLETVTGEESAIRRRFEPRPRNEWIMTTAELLEAGDAIGSMNLLDARDAARFRGESEPIDPVAGHVPGARSLPLTESLAANGQFLDQTALQALWKSVLGDSSEAPWIVMCGSGVTACHLALSGIEAGYMEPRVYVGSWSEWIRDPDRAVATGADETT